MLAMSLDALSRLVDGTWVKTKHALMTKCLGVCNLTIRLSQHPWQCVKVKFTLEEAMNAWRQSRRIALFFLNLGAKWGWVVNATHQPLYPHETDAVPILQEAGWAPGLVWTDAKILPPPAFNPQTAQLVEIANMCQSKMHCCVLCNDTAVETVDGSVWIWNHMSLFKGTGACFVYILPSLPSCLTNFKAYIFKI
jgi:hypothetical protein